MIRTIMLSAAFLGFYTYSSETPGSELTIKITPQLELTISFAPDATNGEKILIIIRALRTKCAELALENNELKELVEELQHNHHYTIEELRQELASAQENYEYALQNIVELQTENYELKDQLEK